MDPSQIDRLIDDHKGHDITVTNYWKYGVKNSNSYWNQNIRRQMVALDMLLLKHSEQCLPFKLAFLIESAPETGRMRR